MSKPVPGEPGETPAQKQARFAAADAVQAKINAEEKAKLEAMVPKVPTRPTMRVAPDKLVQAAMRVAPDKLVQASMRAKKANIAEKLAALTPMKKAAGGAAKVRKDMMSPEGKILNAMNKVRGK
jgi:hypothetical protein